MSDVIPRRPGLVFADRVAPFVPGQEFEARSLAKVRVHRFGVRAQGHGRGRDDVETFANSGIGASKRQLESLRDIVSVHVVNSFHSPIGQYQHLAARDAREDVGIQMAGWIHRIPSRPDKMTRVKDRGARIPAPSVI